jgi:hypothetical protein
MKAIRDAAGKPLPAGRADLPETAVCRLTPVAYTWVNLAGGRRDSSCLVAQRLPITVDNTSYREVFAN